jgi:NAD(P)-dependent dehydrogenase (short-subunit alcohol dehydrogenase family)
MVHLLRADEGKGHATRSGENLPRNCAPCRVAPSAGASVRGKRYTLVDVRITALFVRRGCDILTRPPEAAGRLDRMGQLDGKVALITGASKGIGRVMSRLFAQEGAAVICAARSRDLVEETAGLVKAAGGRAIAVTGDAATEDDVRRMIEHGVKAFSRLDVLVNNAGDGGPTKRVQDYTTDDWFYTINSCLTSSYLCIRFAVPEMITGGGGAIVNITSTAGRRGLPFRIGYCSAKAGQVGMTYGMALELAPHNIRVNAIAPGAVAGDRIDRVIAGQAEVRGVAVDEMRRAFVERSPLKRMSTADDIATLAVYLCSDAAKNLSGQCIAVTAGEPAV